VSSKVERARLIIEKALPHVPFDGWSSSTLSAAARAADVDVNYLPMVFPKGAIDAIDSFVAWADEQMELSVDDAFKALKMPQKIATLILERLERFSNHRDAVRRAVHLCAMPWNITRAGLITFRTIDKMWELAGASDHDFNWYTRRMTLAYVYTTTLKYWLSDEGEEKTKTAAYLQRRLDEAAWVGKTSQRILAKTH
jgi:ubiquinone biosynthesis protein COQ9